MQAHTVRELGRRGNSMELKQNILDKLEDAINSLKTAENPCGRLDAAGR
jgi:hypothetical protein